MSRVCKLFAGTAAALCLELTLLGVSAVRAYDDQASLDLALGYTHVPPAAGLPSSGAQLVLGGGYGLGDMFVLRASVGYGQQLGGGRAKSLGRARAELAYLLDVLSVVPFFGLGGGAWFYDDDGLTAVPIGHGLLGLDILLSREWNVGADVRIGMLLAPDESVTVAEAELRISRMFELF